jgi:hypothetical protein
MDELLDTDSITSLLLLDVLTVLELVAVSIAEDDTSVRATPPEDSAIIICVEASAESLMLLEVPFATTDELVTAASLSISRVDASPFVISIAFTPDEEDLAAAKEDCMPLVTAEVDDLTREVKACFLVDSDFLAVCDVDSLTFVTLVFVLPLQPLEVTSFFVTVILITCYLNVTTLCSVIKKIREFIVNYSRVFVVTTARNGIFL